MKHEFKKENGLLTDVIVYEKAEVTKAINKATDTLILDVTVPGFRKGKAPKEQAVRYLSNERLTNATLDKLLGQAEGDLQKQDEFKPYSRLVFGEIAPAIDIEKFSDSEAQIKITWTLYPELTKLGEYKNVPISEDKKVVNDNAINDELNRLALENAELVDCDDACKVGDSCNIDFEGFTGGEKFDGGSAKGYDIEIGSNKFVPGFEEQLIGHKAGDKFDINVKMPDNYPQPLNSKECVFKTTINSVKTKEVPEINDDFATTLSGDYVSLNLAELKDKIKAKLEKDYDQQYKDAIVNNALLNCRNDSEYIVSDSYIDFFMKQREKEDTEKVEEQGLTLDEYLKLVNMDKDQYKKNLKEAINAEVKDSLVFEEISKNEKVEEPKQSELEAKLGMSIDSFYDQYRKYFISQGMNLQQANMNIQNYLNQLSYQMLRENVINKVLELNLLTPVKEPVKKSAKPSNSQTEEKKSTAKKTSTAKTDDAEKKPAAKKSSKPKAE